MITRLMEKLGIAIVSKEHDEIVIYLHSGDSDTARHEHAFC